MGCHRLPPRTVRSRVPRLRPRPRVRTWAARRRPCRADPDSTAVRAALQPEIRREAKVPGQTVFRRNLVPPARHSPDLGRHPRDPRRRRAARDPRRPRTALLRRATRIRRDRPARAVLAPARDRAVPRILLPRRPNQERRPVGRASRPVPPRGAIRNRPGSPVIPIRLHRAQAPGRAPARDQVIPRILHRVQPTRDQVHRPVGQATQPVPLRRGIRISPGSPATHTRPGRPVIPTPRMLREVAMGRPAPVLPRAGLRPVQSRIRRLCHPPTRRKEAARELRSRVQARPEIPRRALRIPPETARAPRVPLRRWCSRAAVYPERPRRARLPSW